MKMDEFTAFETAAHIWLSVKRLEVKANTYSESYERTVEKILLPRMQSVKLGEIDRTFTIDLFSELASSYSDSTLHKCKIALCGILEEAAYSGASLQPLPKIKIRSKIPKKEKRTYSLEDTEKIKAYCREHNHGLSVILLLELGLRCSEMLGLRWEDIDFSSRFIKIERGCVSVNGKPYIDVPKSESSNRELPISAEFCDYLKSVQTSKEGYVVNVGDKLMTPANYTKHRYNKVFAQMQDAINIERLTPHELRHTCGTLLYKKTGDIYAVSKYLGHSSVAITASYYVHSDVEMLRERLFI